MSAVELRTEVIGGETYQIPIEIYLPSKDKNIPDSTEVYALWENGAVIAQTAQVHRTTQIGSRAIIGPNAIIDKRAIIDNGTVIGEGAKINKRFRAMATEY